MRVEGDTAGIAWRKWSKEAFEEAGRSGKLVLLDLSAEWCHWCHVMDRTTYSDPEVVKTINEEFVPVRVDIDARPDISERYNRGGFPTTAFLSERGESIWGATYIPPKDMKRIMAGVLAAKASGEIADALEKSRMMYIDVTGSTGPTEHIDDILADVLFEDIFSAYDTEHGGFGLHPKFPHPDVLDLMLLKFLVTGDEEVAGAVRHTVSRMTAGLYDKVEGGVFRYSVTRDWMEPHYEKMLETNASFLRNLVGAYKIFGSPEDRDTASGVATYIVERLRDHVSKGFFGSQDADEEYYRLPAEMRAERRAPAVVKVVYGGWNAEAVSALIEAGALFRRKEWIEAAVGGWDYSVSRLWNQGSGLIRHEEGKELYLFEDQVSFLEALLAVYSLTGRRNLLEIGHELLTGVERHFAHPDGGYADVVHDDDAIGELGERRRPLVANSRYARLLALFAAAVHEPELAGRSRAIITSFSRKELEAHGLFAAEALIAWHVIKEGAKVAKISVAGGTDVLSSILWLAAKSVHNPAVLCTIEATAVPGFAGAVICEGTACSGEVINAEDLVRKLTVQRTAGPA